MRHSSIYTSIHNYREPNNTYLPMRYENKYYILYIYYHFTYIYGLQMYMMKKDKMTLMLAHSRASSSVFNLTLSTPSFSDRFKRVTISTNNSYTSEWNLRRHDDDALDGIRFAHPVSEVSAQITIHLFHRYPEYIIDNEYVSSILLMKKGKWSEILRRFEIVFGTFKEEENEIKDQKLRQIFRRDVIRVEELESVLKMVLVPVAPLKIIYTQEDDDDDIRYYALSNALPDYYKQEYSSDPELDRREDELNRMLRWSLRTRSILNLISENPISTMESLIQSDKVDRNIQHVGKILDDVKYSGISDAYDSMLRGGLGTSVFIS